MKTDGWRVTGEEFKIRLTFKNPELHKFITFRAEDLYGNLLLLLDGDRTISVMPRINCDEYIDVTVTGIPGTRLLFSLQKQTEREFKNVTSDTSCQVTSQVLYLNALKETLV